jgi:hypothetical protein
MRIFCPNCDYEGQAASVAGGCFHLVAIVLAGLLSAFFWPLVVVPALLVIHFLVSDRRPTCPVCGWRSPIHLDSWRATSGARPEE